MRFNKQLGLPAQAGQASRMLLVLAVVVLVAVIITYLIIKMATKPPAPPPQQPVVSQPVYETTIGNIKFVYQSAIDRGNILRVSEVTNSQYRNSYQKSLTTGERIIQVTIGAQNNGTENTVQNAWDIGNIIDSEDRNYKPYETSVVAPWLPNPNLCSSILKPAFNPTPCTKFYEVSKESMGLKIKVETKSGSKTSSSLLDLIVY